GGQLDGLRAVTGLGHHFDVALQAEQDPQALPHHGVVVGDQDGDLPGSRRAHRRLLIPPRSSGMATRTVVPCPGAERTSSEASAPAARSRSDRRPRPPVASSGTKPLPSSLTSRVTFLAAAHTDTVTSAAPEWRSALCSASCAIR